MLFPRIKWWSRPPSRQSSAHHLTRAAHIAAEDAEAAATQLGRRFSGGTRPVIRWIKGDGLDDAVTRSAIAQATRIFGSEVDYCMCTQGIDAARARSILEWSDQPVEWWPISANDNPELACLLTRAGCPAEHFGYWWKWFPERVRPLAPEWILDGDMVITARPVWFKTWAEGRDPVRVTQDDLCPPDKLYGSYATSVDSKRKLYSGLISIPPGLRYMHTMRRVLGAQPLKQGHHGILDMCEQGVVAVTFQKLKAKPIPLYEFPFGRAFEAHLDFGRQGDQGKAWGYHFGHAFRMANVHFDRLCAEGVVFTQPPPSILDRFRWLGSLAQWGTPGWSMTDGCAGFILKEARAFSGKDVLELGTSRGRMSAMLSTLGCRLTTVDAQDRGAAQNLAGLGVRVIREEAVSFLSRCSMHFDLIVVDLHGNSPEDWQHYAPGLLSRLKPGGMLLIDNARLYEIPDWREETGVKWFLNQLPPSWTVEIYEDTPPGVAKVIRP